MLLSKHFLNNFVKILSIKLSIYLLNYFKTSYNVKSEFLANPDLSESKC